MTGRSSRVALVVATLAVLAGAGLWLEFVFDKSPGPHRITVVVPERNAGKVAFELDRYRGVAVPVSEMVTPTGAWARSSPVRLTLPAGSGTASYDGVVDPEVLVRFVTGPDGGEAGLVIDGVERGPISLRGASDGIRVERLHFDEHVPTASWLLLALMIGLGAAATMAAGWCVARLAARRGSRSAIAVVRVTALLTVLGAAVPFSSPSVVRSAGTVANVLNHVGVGVAVGLLVLLTTALALGVRPAPAPGWVTAPETNRDRWRLTLLLGLVPFLGWLALHLVFWPGLMNPDVVVQWFQFDRTGLDNWHPYTFAVVIGLLRGIVESPWLPILLQTAGAALLAGRIAAWTVWRGRGPWAAAATLALLPILPPTGLFTVTLWKDAAFGIALLGLALVVWRVEDTKGSWLADWRNALLTSLAIVVLGLTRHNGWPIIIGTAVVLLVGHRLFWRRILFTVAVGSAIVLIVGGPLADLLGVKENRIASIVYVQHIAMHVDDGTHLSESDRKLLETVHPLDGGWPYNCRSIQATWSGPEGIPLERFTDKAPQLRAIAIRLALRNPGAEIHHLVCSSELIWNPLDRKGTTYFLEWSNTGGHVDYIPRSPLSFDDAPTEEPGSPRATARIFDVVTHLPVWVIRPALYLYALLMAIAAAACRRRSWGIVRIAAPATIQSLALAVVSLGQDVRFQYGVMLTAVVLVPAVLTTTRRQLPDDDRPLRWSRRDRRRGLRFPDIKGEDRAQNGTVEAPQERRTHLAR